MFKNLKTFFGAQDLTKGSPMVNLLNFRTASDRQRRPAALQHGGLIVVGKYVGDTALAAIGAVMPIINLLLVLFMACGDRCRHFGFPVFRGRDWQHLDRTIGNALL
jgi:hypothetical protein